MNKHEFFDALRRALAGLPAAEIEKAVNYYNEVFSDHLEEGKTEESIVASLEPVAVIARRIIDETPMHTLIKERARAIRTGNKTLNLLLLILGFPLWFPLLISILAVILSVYLVIWSLILTLFSIVLALALSALVLIFGSPLGFGASPIAGFLMIGGGLICAGLTVFAFLIALYGSRALIRLTGYLARKIRSLFLRKEVAT